MIPVRTEAANAVLKLPGGDDSNDLAIVRATDARGVALQISTWQPSEEERKAIAAGQCVELIVWGTGHPPVAVGVAGVE